MLGFFLVVAMGALLSRSVGCFSGFLSLLGSILLALDGPYSLLMASSR